MPPPSVSPPTPVVEMMPPVVARPNGYVAALKSPHVAPPSARAVLVAGSTRTPRIPDRSITTPPSHVPNPGTLWPPPRTATVEAVLAREVHGRHHVTGVRRTDDRRRPPVDHGVVDDPRLVVAVIVGSDDLPTDQRTQIVDLQCSHVLPFPSG